MDKTVDFNKHRWLGGAMGIAILLVTGVVSCFMSDEETEGCSRADRYDAQAEQLERYARLHRICGMVETDDLVGTPCHFAGTNLNKVWRVDCEPTEKPKDFRNILDTVEPEINDLCRVQESCRAEFFHVPPP